MATLKLERRGCDYFGQDATREDGIGNYRVCAEFTDKKGTSVFVEFHRGPVYEFTYRGKPRKHPKKISDWGVHVNAQYEDADGWHPYRFGKETWHHVTEFPWYGAEYTKGNLLAIVNSVSRDHYTDCV